MISVLPVPFVSKSLALLAAFSTGIIIGVKWQADPVYLLIAAFCGLLLLLYLRKRGRIGTVTALTVAVLAGMAAVSVQLTDLQGFIPPEPLINRLVSISGTINSTPRVYDGTTAFVLDCDSLYFDGVVYRIGGMIPCTILGRELIMNEGDHIAFRGILRTNPRLVDSGGIVLPSTPYQSQYRLIATPASDDQIIYTEKQGILSNLRKTLAVTINRLPFGGYGDLVKAMTIGDTRQLDPALRDMFARAGIAHLLAVSGLHAGIVALAAMALFRMAGVGRSVRFFGVMLFLFGYTAICGFRPPVVRATVMSMLVLGAILMERRVRSEHMLSIAALVILAFDPLALFGPSFQLSFAGVWTIVTFHPPVTGYLRTKLRWYGPAHPILTYACSLLVVSILATIGTAPVAAAHFGMVPVLAVPVNALAIPLAFPIIYFATGAIILSGLGTIIAPVTWVAAAGAGLCLRSITGLAGLVAGLPFSSIDIETFGPLAAVTVVSWFFLLSRATGRPIVRKTLMYLPLIVVLAVTWQPLITPAMQRPVGHRIVFFDVGQGDAALVSTPDNRHFLIDTGTASAGERIVVPGLRALGVIKLDGVFVSHMDDDHAGGLASILNAVPVEYLFCREDVADSLDAIYESIITGLSAGDSISVRGCGFAVLSPLSGEKLTHRNGLGENNASLVLRYSADDMRVLFSGDIEQEAQQVLTAWESSLAGIVLKVPHHGAAPLDRRFAMTIRPELAIVSCGRNNRYGHPASETLSQLEDIGASVLRTDRDGPIAIIFGQDGLTVQALSK